MAQDTTGLFGMSPAEVQQAINAQQQQQALNFANLEPNKIPAYMAYSAGTGIGNMLGGLFGQENPAITRAKVMQDVQAAMANEDFSNQADYADKAAKLIAQRANGDPGLMNTAMQISNWANQYRGSQAKTGLENAQAMAALSKSRLEDRQALQDMTFKNLPDKAKYAWMLQNGVYADGVTPLDDATKKRLQNALQEEQWGDPFTMNGVPVQKNSATGQIRAVINPITTTAEVINPQNPQQLLRVNPALYGGGGIGSQGVLGVSGKEPTAAKDAQSKLEGADQFNSLISGLNDAYGRLNASNAIVSNENRAGTNLGAYIQSSGLGQGLGHMFGTDNQTIRDEITGMRPLLMAAIKQISGLSSKQMDSNKELSFYLEAATNPTKSYEYNMKQLQKLNELYGPNGIRYKNAQAQLDPNTYASSDASQMRTPQDVQNALSSGKITSQEAGAILKDMKRSGVNTQRKVVNFNDLP